MCLKEFEHEAVSAKHVSEAREAFSVTDKNKIFGE
jgi:hypothetical protein